MKCPSCGGKRSSVYDTRLVSDAMLRWRRHECKKCRRMFTTYEMAVDESQGMLALADVTMSSFGEVLRAIGMLTEDQAEGLRLISKRIAHGKRRGKHSSELRAVEGEE